MSTSTTVSVTFANIKVMFAVHKLFVLTLLSVALTDNSISVHYQNLLDGNIGIKFLVTVNDTWKKNGCIATIATPMLMSGVESYPTNNISVGNCDNGPLLFNVSQTNEEGNARMQVDLIFFSTVIETAAPPSCSIAWNGTYLLPMTTDPRESLLPGCFVQDSRDGFYLTYYWFHILDWLFY